MDWSRIDFWFNEVLFLYIANVLGLKALLLRRETRLGFWLAMNNTAFTVGYVGASLREWVSFFDSTAWTVFIRLAIAFTATMVLRQFWLTFGGPRGMRREVVRSLRHAPPGDREGY